MCVSHANTRTIIWIRGWEYTFNFTQLSTPPQPTHSWRPAPWRGGWSCSRAWGRAWSCASAASMSTSTLRRSSSRASTSSPTYVCMLRLGTDAFGGRIGVVIVHLTSRGLVTPTIQHPTPLNAPTLLPSQHTPSPTTQVALLDMLANGTNPRKIVPYLSDCYDALAGLRFVRARSGSVRVCVYVEPMYTGGGGKRTPQYYPTPFQNHPPMPKQTPNRTRMGRRATTPWTPWWPRTERAWRCTSPSPCRVGGYTCECMHICTHTPHQFTHTHRGGGALSKPAHRHGGRHPAVRSAIFFSLSLSVPVFGIH